MKAGARAAPEPQVGYVAASEQADRVLIRSGLVRTTQLGSFRSPTTTPTIGKNQPSRLTYNVELTVARSRAVADALDLHGIAVMEFLTDSGATIIRLPLSSPSFVVGSGGELVMQGMPRSTLAVAAGTTTTARFVDGAGTVIISGLSVGYTVSDICINDLSYTVGQSFEFVGGSISPPQPGAQTAIAGPVRQAKRRR